MSVEKIGDYCIGVHYVRTNIFGSREVLAYVTASEISGGSRRLLFSMVFPEPLQIFFARQEKPPLNQSGSNWMKYIPLLLYSFRSNIEVSYYEQKMFWSLCCYMIQSRKGIEINIEISIKSNVIVTALKHLIQQRGDYL